MNTYTNIQIYVLPSFHLFSFLKFLKLFAIQNIKMPLYRVIQNNVQKG